jgi:hypothetical protein
MSEYVKHFYDGNLKIRSELYTSQDHIEMVITYKYDVNGNLITEEAIMTNSTGAPIDYYFLRYEYY